MQPHRPSSRVVPARAWLSVMLLKAAAVLLALIGDSHGAAQDAKPNASAGAIQHVIIVSVDGLMPATYLSPDELSLQVPTLRELARSGAVAAHARSVFPSVTYPAHASIATGVNPRKHGIATNPAWDPMGRNQEGWRWYAEDIRVTTLWDAARRRGLRTALAYWPVTVGARATALVPEYWRAGTAEDLKLARALSTPGLLAEVQKKFPTFLAGYTPPEVKDESLTDVAVHMLETVRPHLLMLHIFQVDHWQHEKGLGSPEAKAAIEIADAQIARLIAAAKRAGIWQRTALVLVSDHGFAAVSQRLRPGVLLREAGLVTLGERNRVKEWQAVTLTAAGHAYIYLKDAADTATQQRVLEVFRPLAGQPGSGVGRVYTQAEIAELGGDAQAFLALEGAEGFAMASGYAGDRMATPSNVATHGFHPERADMQASLIMYGPPIAPGKITAARLIDVAPTVAQWLGLKLSEAEGRPLNVNVRRAAPLGKSPAAR